MPARAVTLAASARVAASRILGKACSICPGSRAAEAATKKISQSMSMTRATTIVPTTALTLAQKSGKPAAINLSAVTKDDKEPPKTQTPMTVDELEERLLTATRNMQEMNRSFNLQYLAVQQQIQSDNRKFTVLSNVMKTKHDTAKNAINNVR